jgi:hypothetical protein
MVIVSSSKPAVRVETLHSREFSIITPESPVMMSGDPYDIVADSERLVEVFGFVNEVGIPRGQPPVDTFAISLGGLGVSVRGTGNSTLPTYSANSRTQQIEVQVPQSRSKSATVSSTSQEQLVVAAQNELDKLVLAGFAEAIADTRANRKLDRQGASMLAGSVLLSPLAGYLASSNLDTGASVVVSVGTFTGLLVGGWNCFREEPRERSARRWVRKKQDRNNFGIDRGDVFSTPLFYYKKSETVQV